jgi:hypothetical protein
LWTAAGDDAPDDATLESATLPPVLDPPVLSGLDAIPTSAFPGSSGDCVAEGADDLAAGAADGDVAAPVTYVAFLDGEQESSPTQTSGPSRALAVIRRNTASMYTSRLSNGLQASQALNHGGSVRPRQ